MPEPWEAEDEVSPARARRLVAAAAPELADAPIDLLDPGWDNTAYLVGGRWVFRFPRRAATVGPMENEIRALPRIAPRLPLAAPNPLHVGGPTGDYPWPYAGYARVPGDVAALRALDAERRAANATALGSFLAALHGLPARELLDAGLPRDGHVEDGEALLALARASAPGDWTPRRDTLVHGDLDARHLLVDAASRLTGVIDRGDLHVGEPATSRPQSSV